MCEKRVSSETSEEAGRRAEPARSPLAKEGGMTAEERTVELLTEIRDLQRTHLQRYEEVLSNQSESIEAQRDAIDYQKRTIRRVMMALIPLIVIFLVLALGTMVGLVT
jgi:hypothetical protein